MADSLAKFILLFVNIFFALAGLTLLGLGTALELRISAVTEVFKDSQIYQLTPIGAIVIGCIVFLIAFFGCYVAITESNSMLITYSVFMIFLIILKITLVTLIFLKQDEAISRIPSWLVRTFATDRREFQQIERTFGCCGPKGPESYPTFPVLPSSCCPVPICAPFIAYEGCDIVVPQFFNALGLTIAIIATIAVLVELVAAVFGLCLARDVRLKKRIHY